MIIAWIILHLSKIQKWWRHKTPRDRGSTGARAAPFAARSLRTLYIESLSSQFEFLPA